MTSAPLTVASSSADAAAAPNATATDAGTGIERKAAATPASTDAADVADAAEPSAEAEPSDAGAADVADVDVDVAVARVV